MNHKPITNDLILSEHEFAFDSFPTEKINKITNMLLECSIDGMYFDQMIKLCKSVLVGWTGYRYVGWETSLSERKIYNEFFDAFLDYIKIMNNVLPDEHKIGGLYTGNIYRYLGNNTESGKDCYIEPQYDNMFTSFSTTKEIPTVTSKLSSKITLLSGYINEDHLGIRLRDFINCPEDEIVCKMSKDIIVSIDYIDKYGG